MSDQEKIQRIEYHLIEIEAFLNSRTHLYVIASLLLSYLATLAGFILALQIG